MSKFGIGQAVRRVEDQRFTTGSGQFVADLTLPLQCCGVAVLAPPTDEAHATVLALLADGETWSSSALALALGVNQRTVQRALDDLAANGKVQAIGRGRARRWIAPPLPGFPTTLLLPAALPGG